MRHGLLLIGLLCFALSPALAQTGQIHGRVTDDATGEPLPGATIAVLATDQRYRDVLAAMDRPDDASVPAGSSPDGGAD